MVAAYGRLRARDPERVEAIAGEARAYARALRRLGVRDPWALELAALRPGAVAGALVRLALAAPVAALGAVMSWLPYRLAGRIAARVTKDEDILGTVKLIAGATFLTLAWALEADGRGAALGPPLGGAGLRAAALAAGTSPSGSRRRRARRGLPGARWLCAPSTGAPPSSSPPAAARSPTTSPAPWPRRLRETSAKIPGKWFRNHRAVIAEMTQPKR